MDTSLELSLEGGVFCNEFLIPLAFDRRLRHRGNRANRFGVLQVGFDRRHHDARLDGDQIDPHQRDANPCVDDDSLVQHSVENVNKTCAACCAFNGHRDAPCSGRSSLAGGRPYFRGAAVRRRVRDASCRSNVRTCFFSSSFSADSACFPGDRWWSYFHQSRPICSALSIEQMSSRIRIVRSSTSASDTLMSPATTRPLSSTRSSTSTRPVDRPCPSVSGVGMSSVFYGTFRSTSARLLD